MNVSTFSQLYVECYTDDYPHGMILLVNLFFHFLRYRSAPFFLYDYLHSKILSNLVHLNNESDITTDLSVQGFVHLLFKEDLPIWTLFAIYDSFPKFHVFMCLLLY